MFSAALRNNTSSSIIRRLHSLTPATIYANAINYRLKELIQVSNNNILQCTIQKQFFSIQLTAKKLNNNNKVERDDAEEEIIEEEEEGKAADSIPAGFSSLGLRPSLILGLKEQFSIVNPTQIQRFAIQSILNNSINSSTQNYNPILLASQTGSGKSLAYLLPIIELLKREEEENKNNNNNNSPRIARPRCIILTPNRELTHQLLFVCKQLSHYAKYRSVAISGGEEKKKQLRELNTAIDILISTPGRLIQLMEQDMIKLTECSYVVVDEADTMFTEQNGFLPILRQILTPIRERLKNLVKINNNKTNLLNNNDNNSNPSSYINARKCQFILSTASVPTSIEPVIKLEFPHLRKLNSTELHKLPSQLIQEFVTVGNQDKLYVLLELLKREEKLFKQQKEKKNIDNNNNNNEEETAGSLPPTLIFCNTVDSCRAVDYFLRENGIRSVNYHGEIPPKLRETHFQSFLNNEVSILVCTDIASRGLDTKFVSHVILFDMSLNPIDYLHRVGRTARIGNIGRATSLITKGDKILANAIQNAFEKNEPISTLSSDKKDYKIETPLIPAILRPESRIRPLFKKLGINPAKISNNNIQKLADQARSGSLPALAQPLVKSQKRWERYKTAQQKLREKITDSIAKQKRIFEDQQEFKLRVAKFSAKEENKYEKKKSKKNDRDQISRSQVQKYYKKMGLGKKTQ